MTAPLSTRKYSPTSTLKFSSPSSSHPLPLQSATSSLGQDNNLDQVVIEFLHAFATDKAQEESSSSSVTAGLQFSEVIWLVQASTQKNKREVEHRKKAIMERLQEVQYRDSTLLHPHHLLRHHFYLTPLFYIFGRKIQLCTACVRISNLVMAPTFRIRPTCKPAFICDNFQMSLRRCFLDISLQSYQFNSRLVWVFEGL